MTGKRPGNSMRLGCASVSFEFSAFSDGSSTLVACKITTFRVNACPHLRRITTTQSHKFLCRASQTQTPMAPQAEASPS